MRGCLEGLGNEHGVIGRLPRAQVKGLEAAVREPAVKGGGDGADCVLKECETLVEGGGVVGGAAHEDVLFCQKLVAAFVERRWGRGKVPSAHLCIW